MATKAAKRTTVEPPIADSPRSGTPLCSGQNTIPRMNLPCNTRTSNLRKAATYEFSKTDNRGIPCNTSNRRPHPNISMHDCCEDEDSDEIDLALKINIYKEVNECLKEVQHFLESRGNAMEAFKIGSIMDDVSCKQINATRQTALDSWLVSSQ